MKKKWLGMFIFCVMSLFCINAKVSAETTSSVKAGKTTYYVSSNSLNKIYKKTSGKDKVVVKKGSDDTITLICAYKNYLYFIMDSYGDNYSTSLMKYGIKTKKTTVIKKVNKADASTLYSKGIIYIHFSGEKYYNAIYSYNCKTNKYKKFVKIDKNIMSNPLLGIYDNYIYFYNDYCTKDGKEYSKLMKCGIKNKKVSTVKKFNQLIGYWHYKGYIVVNYGWSDSVFISDGFSIYNCKKKSLYRVSKNSTCPFIADGKWYFVEEVSKGKYYVMKCDLNGKNKKKVKEIPSDFDRIDNITKKAAYYYGNDDKLHKVTFK